MISKDILRKQTQNFQKNLYSGDMLAKILNTQHIFQNHMSSTDESTLDRILFTKASANTRFKNQTLMYDSLYNVLDARMKHIIQWLYDSKEDTFTITDEPYLENHTDVNGEPLPIGIGFKQEHNKIAEYETTYVTMHLQRADNEYGFVIVTAYPDIKTPEAVPTGRDLTDLIKQTTTYQTVPDHLKLRLEHMVTPTPKPNHIKQTVDELTSKLYPNGKPDIQDTGPDYPK